MAVTGTEMVDAPTEAIASLEPVETSAGIVETAVDRIAGASTTGDWVAVTVTSDVGVASSLCGIAEPDGKEIVSTDDAPETKDCEAPICLGLTVNRTTATPTPVPRSMVSICSKTICLLHLDSDWP